METIFSPYVVLCVVLALVAVGLVAHVFGGFGSRTDPNDKIWKEPEVLNVPDRIQKGTRVPPDHLNRAQRRAIASFARRRRVRA